MSKTAASRNAVDPLIDEVRAVRKSISDRVGDDFDKLAEYYRQVGEEYRTRTGRFASQKPERPSR
ncbi:MAG: hypothetical protein QUV05_23800 [Phycisphaerae bacterium]|nr:hypothetical protein [Phycisphaerae bacterium]